MNIIAVSRCFFQHQWNSSTQLFTPAKHAVNVQAVVLFGFSFLLSLTLLDLPHASTKWSQNMAGKEGTDTLMEMYVSISSLQDEKSSGVLSSQ